MNESLQLGGVYICPGIFMAGIDTQSYAIRFLSLNMKAAARVIYTVNWDISWIANFLEPDYNRWRSFNGGLCFSCRTRSPHRPIAADVILSPDSEREREIESLEKRSKPAIRHRACKIVAKYNLRQCNWRHAEKCVQKSFQGTV